MTRDAEAEAEVVSQVSRSAFVDGITIDKINSFWWKRKQKQKRRNGTKIHRFHIPRNVFRYLNPLEKILNSRPSTLRKGVGTNLDRLKIFGKKILIFFLFFTAIAHDAGNHKVLTRE